MSGRNKGFDPLSSLFSAPDPVRGVALPDIDEEELALRSGKVELTDPWMKRPPPPPDTLPPAEDEEELLDRAALARKLAMEAIAKADPLPPEDSEEIAKELLAQQLAARAAADAAQPAAPPPAAPTPAAPTPAVPTPAAAPDQDKSALARKLAADAIAKTQAPAQAAAAPDQDKATLARKLAADAIAKAHAAPAPAAPTEDQISLARRVGAAASAAAASQPSEVRAKAPSKASRAKSGRSRVASLAARARKPTSALEAARAAARDEEERQAQDLRKKANRLRDVVQELVPEWLPGIGTVFVANAIAVQQRDLLKALWRGHRSKFLADGQLERAVGAAAVLAALDQAPEGTLVAAHAVTDASDYLVWLDLDKSSLVAAFADARAYFAAGA